MKRLIAILMAALMLCVCAAAEVGNGYVGTMYVDYCEEWVSLRARPDTKSDALARVPLHAEVMNCSIYDSRFTYCEYDGLCGYILSEYLTEDYPDAPYAEETVDGLDVIINQYYDEDGEHLSVTVLDDYEGMPLWSREFTVADITELSSTAGFVNRYADKPMVMVYCAREGLYAIDARSGAVLWRIPMSAGSLSWAVDTDGTMFVGGYYGPDPVAISQYGEVLWQANSGSNDIFWLYEIHITDEGIVGIYDSIDGQGGSGSVLYDWNGNTVRIMAD